jgi:hypothetical protein
MPADFVENASAYLAVRAKSTDADSDLSSCAMRQRQNGEASLKVVGRLGIDEAAAERIESLLANPHVHVCKRSQHRHTTPAKINIVVAAPIPAMFEIGAARVLGL